MREPNHDDARLALRLYSLRREKEMRKARRMVANDLFGAPWSEVEKRLRWEHPSNAHFRQVTSYWEVAASFVNRGIFHPDVYLDTCGEGLFLYAILEPHIEKVRSQFGPRFLAKTQALIEAHPACLERVEAVRAMIAHHVAQATAAREAKQGKRKRKIEGSGKKAGDKKANKRANKRDAKADNASGELKAKAQAKREGGGKDKQSQAKGERKASRRKAANDKPVANDEPSTNAN